MSNNATASRKLAQDFNKGKLQCNLNSEISPTALLRSTSEDEAAVLALDSRFQYVTWAFDSGDRCGAEVCEVEYEGPVT
jgi:hypothetical protein